MWGGRCACVRGILRPTRWRIGGQGGPWTCASPPGPPPTCHPLRQPFQAPGALPRTTHQSSRKEAAPPPSRNSPTPRPAPPRPARSLGAEPRPVEKGLVTVASEEGSRRPAGVGWGWVCLGRCHCLKEGPLPAAGSVWGALLHPLGRQTRESEDAHPRPTPPLPHLLPCAPAPFPAFFPSTDSPQDRDHGGPSSDPPKPALSIHPRHRHWPSPLLCASPAQSPTGLATPGLTLALASDWGLHGPPGSVDSVTSSTIPHRHVHHGALCLMLPHPGTTLGAHKVWGQPSLLQWPRAPRLHLMQAQHPTPGCIPFLQTCPPRVPMSGTTGSPCSADGARHPPAPRLTRSAASPSPWGAKPDPLTPDFPTPPQDGICPSPEGLTTPGVCVSQGP